MPSFWCKKIYKFTQTFTFTIWCLPLLYYFVLIFSSTYNVVISYDASLFVTRSCLLGKWNYVADWLSNWLEVLRCASSFQQNEMNSQVIVSSTPFIFNSINLMQRRTHSTYKMICQDTSSQLPLSYVGFQNTFELLIPYHIS